MCYCVASVAQVYATFSWSSKEGEVALTVTQVMFSITLCVPGCVSYAWLSWSCIGGTVSTSG